MHENLLLEDDPCIPIMEMGIKGTIGSEQIPDSEPHYCSEGEMGI